MVDFKNIPRTLQITKKPFKPKSRDFDEDPLLNIVDGHVFIVKNNEVLHLPVLCRWVKKT